MINDHLTAHAPQGGTFLPERIIPLPTSISPEARASLAAPRPPAAVFPARDNMSAWRALIANANIEILAMQAPMIEGMPARSKRTEIAGVPVYIAEPVDMPAANRDKALIYFHMGALVLFGGEPVGQFATIEAVAMRCKVFAIDYRTPPDYPFPAALEDGVAVYRALLAQYAPERLVVSGASGGGNLAAALPLKLRDLGLPLPSAVGLFSPEVDLTESGDTFQTNRDIDVVLPKGLPELNALYAGSHELSDPYISPLFADFSKGFPPTYIQTGTRDLLLSNSVRMHRALRRAGLLAELHVWEAMPHNGFGFGPEDCEKAVEFGHFLSKFAGWAKP